MNYDLQPWDGARALCSAGVLRAVNRAGFPPRNWKEENDLELMFDAPGGVEDFRIMVGATGASDLRIARGTLRNTARAGVLFSPFRYPARTTEKVRYLGLLRQPEPELRSMELAGVQRPFLARLVRRARPAALPARA